MSKPERSDSFINQLEDYIQIFKEDIYKWFKKKGQESSTGKEKNDRQEKRTLQPEKNATNTPAPPALEDEVAPQVSWDIKNDTQTSKSLIADQEKECTTIGYPNNPILHEQEVNKKNEAIYYLTEYKDFIELETSFLNLLKQAEQEVKDLYLKCCEKKLEKEDAYLAKILGKYILSKPQAELSRWEGIIYNLQFSGLVVDPIKNSLQAETAPNLQIKILKESIFYSLHQKYLNSILLLIEYSLQLKSANETIKQKKQELNKLLNNIKNKSINDLDININYVSLNQKLENDEQFNSVQIKVIEGQAITNSEQNIVAEILEYGINYGNSNHKKTIIQCYVQH